MVSLAQCNAKIRLRGSLKEWRSGVGVLLVFLNNTLLRDGMQSIGGENIVFERDCWVVYLGYGMTL